MLTVAIVVGVVSLALVFGAAWGLWGRFPPPVAGFVVALAGGALIVSVMSGLIEPAADTAPLWIVVAAVAAGAVTFTVLDGWVERRFAGSHGIGLLLAVTLDGVPENLALGVALIGAGPADVAALAGAILLSNLPEAAGGARGMARDGMGRWRALAIWSATGMILAAAAVVGNLALASAPPEPLAAIKCFAAGAVVASLAITVFPQAWNEGHRSTGIAVALGLILALLLGEMGSPI